MKNIIKNNQMDETNNNLKIEFLQDQLHFKLELAQGSISFWQQIKFNLMYHKYYIRFWKNKQRMMDIIKCDKEIEKAEYRYKNFEKRAHKKIDELTPKIEFTIPDFLK